MFIVQVGPIPAMPPGQIQNSLWDVHGKDIKTEQQILVSDKFSIHNFTPFFCVKVKIVKKKLFCQELVNSDQT